MLAVKTSPGAKLLFCRIQTIHSRSAPQIQKSASKEVKPREEQRIQAPVPIPLATDSGLAEVEGRKKEARLLR